MGWVRRKWCQCEMKKDAPQNRTGIAPSSACHFLLAGPEGPSVTAAQGLLGAVVHPALHTPAPSLAFGSHLPKGLGSCSQGWGCGQGPRMAL